jgi:hypothetical protein
MLVEPNTIYKSRSIIYEGTIVIVSDVKWFRKRIRLAKILGWEIESDVVYECEDLFTGKQYYAKCDQVYIAEPQDIVKLNKAK